MPECLCKYYKPCDYCHAIELATQRLQELEQGVRKREEQSDFQIIIHDVVNRQLASYRQLSFRL